MSEPLGLDTDVSEELGEIERIGQVFNFDYLTALAVWLTMRGE